MAARLIAAAAFAVLVSSCSSVYDTSEFLARGKADGRSVAAISDSAAPVSADPAAKTDAADPTQPAAADAAAPAAAADVAAASTSPEEPGPPVSSAVTAPPARGLLAMFSIGEDTTPTAAAAEAASEETPAAAGTPAAAAETPAPTTPAAAAEPEIPTEDAAPDEISEADLAGEVEADPDKIAVPEQPVDDGMEHDFVNVYTSKPDAPVEMIAGLPGVTWEGAGFVVASRGDGGDPGSLFGGENHPFARTVPGIPRQVVQAANGLLLAHSAINVGCVKSDLLSLVHRAESHFGKKVVVTSGYRSPAHNRRVHGAKHSQHMFCNALDLYMPGVARDDLARFFFAQPDRGGIGLYCHTRSIHIDTGKRRQWRWSCRGRG